VTSPVERIVVIIPARDEAGTLARCLESVQRAGQRAGVPTTVVIVLDSCTDGSAEIAASFADALVIEEEFANVGRSRARGFAHALASFAGDPDRIWLATTDADSVVPPDWLAEHLRAAEEGAHVFVGAVVPILDELDDHRRVVWERTHPPGATVGHVHGANLGMLASAYTAVGGFAALETGEDVELVARLRRLGVPIAESEAHPVITSSRLSGRARDGYARYLAELARFSAQPELRSN
jgi:glycosyltransferase involved in cell wall biosynthesis